MNLHDLYGGLRNAQMRVFFEHLGCRLVGFRLHDCIEHDVVSAGGAALRRNPPRFADAGSLVGENAGVLAHPFLPITLHL